MMEAAQKYLGEHDFRNFCKIDVAKSISYRRNILEVDISPVKEIVRYRNLIKFESQMNLFCSSSPDHQLYVITIKGSAFLWHQVRCMVAVLFMIGEGLESPSVIEELLDVEKNTKPCYEMASEIPLVLCDAGYDPMPEWHYGADNKFLIRKLEELWTNLMIKAAEVSALYIPFRSFLKDAMETPQHKQHTSLMKRPRDSKLSH